MVLARCPGVVDQTERHYPAWEPQKQENIVQKQE
jgi:hypothetical protein